MGKEAVPEISRFLGIVNDWNVFPRTRSGTTFLRSTENRRRRLLRVQGRGGPRRSAAVAGTERASAARAYVRHGDDLDVTWTR